MAKFTDALKGIVATIAPTLGVALGGPLGGAAGTMLAKALGKEGATDEELEQAIVTADPETLLKIKAADLEFQQFLKKADIELTALDNADRASARGREVQLRDWTPSVLSAVIVAGFFITVGWLLKYGLPNDGGDAVLMLLGTLGSGFIAVLNYYFGSSSGSQRKQATIDAVLGKK